jgi:hypothetical protein
MRMQASGRTASGVDLWENAVPKAGYVLIRASFEAPQFA